MTIKDFMTHKHRDCDRLLTLAEDAVESGDFEDAMKKYEDFKKETILHFDMEEDYLFPIFEEKSQMGSMGPTNVMKMEHSQAKALFEKMDEAYKQQDKDRIYALGESMNILLQQHNAKEEQMLYTMINSTFVNENDEIVNKLMNYE